MTRFDAAPCDHPEDRREPVEYHGRPADPDEWECGVCGTWQLRKEPTWVGVDLGHGVSTTTAVLLGPWSPYLGQMSARELVSFEQEFERQIQVLIRTTQLAGVAMSDLAAAADRLRHYSMGTKPDQMYYVLHPDTVRSVRWAFLQQYGHTQPMLASLYLFGSEIVEIDIPPDRLGFIPRREIERVAARMLEDRAFKTSYPLVVPALAPTIYNPPTRTSVYVVDPDTGVTTEIGPSVISDVQLTMSVDMEELSKAIDKLKEITP